MSVEENYRDQTFLVTDPDARIRPAGNLLDFEVYKPGDDIPAGSAAGDFKRIPKGTAVGVDAVEVLPTGSKAQLIFARAISADGAAEYGWTSTRNFDGQFRNATLGSVDPEPGAGQYSQTAAWKGGDYIGQLTLVRIVDAGLEIEMLTEAMTVPYFEMIEAASSDGVAIHINSGFRTYPHQKLLYEGWKKGLPGYNKAAPPGSSNHQNGIALDIPVSGGPGDPRYDWLAANATAHGFIRTVKSEPWHWEYRPEDAEKARAKGSHKL